VTVNPSTSKKGGRKGRNAGKFPTTSRRFRVGRDASGECQNQTPRTVGFLRWGGVRAHLLPPQHRGHGNSSTSSLFISAFIHAFIAAVLSTGTTLPLGPRPVVVAAAVVAATAAAVVVIVVVVVSVVATAAAVVEVAVAVEATAAVVVEVAVAVAVEATAAVAVVAVVVHVKWFRCHHDLKFRAL
jgi:hypothetical protein